MDMEPAGPVRPKPRYAFVKASKPDMPLLSHAPEGDPGREILDILLLKKANKWEAGPRGSTTPLDCGSPPIRAGNPLIHDVHFTKEMVPSVSLEFSYGLGAKEPSTALCLSYGQCPNVRIVGFTPSNAGATQGVQAFA